MGNLLFWLGIGAAQKGTGSKPIERQHWVASLIVDILGALLIALDCFFCWSATDNDAALKTRLASTNKSLAETNKPPGPGHAIKGFGPQD